MSGMADQILWVLEDGDFSSTRVAQRIKAGVAQVYRELKKLQEIRRVKLIGIGSGARWSLTFRRFKK